MCGLDPAASNEEDDSAIAYCCKYGMVDCVKLFFDLKDHIDQVEHDGTTLLMYACHDRDNVGPIMQLLVSRGADIHARNRDGKTALMYAAENVNVAALSFLLDHGASVTDRDNEGYDALLWWTHLSNMNYHKPIVSDSLDLLLERGANIHTRTNDGRSALLVSVQLVCPSVLEMLLQHGANPNDVIEDGSGKTALMEACEQGSVKMVKLLLDQGADPLGRDRDGHTAADYASRARNKVELVALLNLEPVDMNFIMK
jgi:ankyrin repeat protein